MGNNCSLCFPLLYKSHYSEEYEIFEGDSDNFETVLTKISKNTGTSDKPCKGYSSEKSPLTYQEDDQILILREGEEDTPDLRRKRCGKEDFQILKVFFEISFEFLKNFMEFLRISLNFFEIHLNFIEFLMNFIGNFIEFLMNFI